MMTVTFPLALSAGELWVFTIYVVDGAELGVDGFRLGLNPTTGQYCTFTPEAFHIDTVVPIARATGEPVPDYRWATVTDVETHAYPATTPTGGRR